MKDVKKKWTPILVFLPILIIIFTVKLLLTQWSSLCLLVIMAFAIDIVAFILIDRILIRLVNIKYVWISEITFLSLIVLIKICYSLSFYDMIFLIY